MHSPLLSTIARRIRVSSNDERMIVRSHLGTILKPGNHVLGYDVRAVTMAGTCRFGYPYCSLCVSLVFARGTVVLRFGWQCSSLRGFILILRFGYPYSSLWVSLRDGD